MTAYSVLRDGEVLCQTVALTCLIQDLTNGVPVSFVVVASNAVGTSDWSSPSDPAIPAAVPEVPGNVSVTPATDGATLSWTEPSNGGEPITRYRIAVWNETQRVTEIDVEGTTARIENLVYPTVYRFTIEAVNAVGTSAQVAVFSAPLAPPPPPVVEPPVVEPPVNPEPPTPPSTTAPSSPRTLTLRSVSRSFYTLTWLEPHNGGSPITDYRIAKRVSSRGVFTAVNDGVNNRRSVRIPRPSNGTAIYVRVVSVNSTGESTTPTVVMLKGKKIYAIPSVVAVRLSDAAAFAGLDARSTPYDGTSVARGFAHWSFL